MDTIWVLTQEINEEAETTVWVHATEEGAIAHMIELANDLQAIIDDRPTIRIYDEYWGCWVLKDADNTEDLMLDDIATWGIERQQVFS